MSETRYEELLAKFGGPQPVNDDRSIVLRCPSHTCSQRMRVSKWKRYELMNTRGGIRPTAPGTLTTMVASNGMRFRLAPSSK